MEREVITTANQLYEFTLSQFKGTWVPKHKYTLENHSTRTYLRETGTVWDRRESIDVGGELRDLLLKKWTKKKTSRYSQYESYVGVRDLISVVSLIDDELGKKLKKKSKESKSEEERIHGVNRRNRIRDEARKMYKQVNLLMKDATSFGLPDSLEAVAVQMDESNS